MQTALMLGVITVALYFIEYAGGRNFITQPIMVGAIVGLFMGDLTVGVITGATLELAFLGATSIGAVIPPDAMTGSLLGTAFVINSGVSASNAVVLALPIASLALIFKNFYYSYVVSLAQVKVDKMAAEGNYQGVERAHWLIGTGMAFMLGILVTASYALGSSTMTKLLNAIPEFVQTGLNVTIGILPAIGFVMLARTMLTKKIFHIFLAGFAVVAYGKLPILGVAIFGLVIAITLLQVTDKNNSGEMTVDSPEGGINDDF